MISMSESVASRSPRRRRSRAAPAAPHPPCARRAAWGSRRALGGRCSSAPRTGVPRMDRRGPADRTRAIGGLGRRRDVRPSPAAAARRPPDRPERRWARRRPAVRCAARRLFRRPYRPDPLGAPPPQPCPSRPRPRLRPLASRALLLSLLPRRTSPSPRPRPASCAPVPPPRLVVPVAIAGGGLALLLVLVVRAAIGWACPSAQHTAEAQAQRFLDALRASRRGPRGARGRPRHLAHRRRDLPATADRVQGGDVLSVSGGGETAVATVEVTQGGEAVHRGAAARRRRDHRPVRHVPDRRVGLAALPTVTVDFPRPDRRGRQRPIAGAANGPRFMAAVLPAPTPSGWSPSTLFEAEDGSASVRLAGLPRPRSPSRCRRRAEFQARALVEAYLANRIATRLGGARARVA